MNRYGDKITFADYYKKMSELAFDSKNSRGENRRLEVDIRIDYLLGKDYPKDLREKLYKVQKKINFVIMLSLIPCLFDIITFRIFKLMEKVLIGLMKFTKKEYSKVLSKEDMEEYFGQDNKLFEGKINGI